MTWVIWLGMTWLMIGGRASIKQTDFSQDSITRARKYEIGYSLKSTSDFEKEPSGLSFSAENSFTNTSEIKAEVFYRTTGKDNRITRKSALSPFINMPKGYGVELEYSGPSDDFFQYGFEVDRRQGSRYSAALGWQTSYQGKSKYLPCGYTFTEFVLQTRPRRGLAELVARQRFRHLRKETKDYYRRYAMV